jgi:hypothetical protein
MNVGLNLQIIKKLFSVLALVLLVGGSLSANSNIENESTLQQGTDCNVHATAVALQAPAYGISYWEAWFYSYGWCLENLN